MTPDLKGARVAILGSGREGLSAYEYLSARGDTASLAMITEGRSGRSREADLESRGLLRVCPFDEVDFSPFDVLVRSPGVSIYRQCLQRASDAGVSITSPSSIWFQAHPDARTVVITGTKGKSTTSALLAHLGRARGFKVQLAGNIGTPLLACDDSGIDWWVIELSSYQIADLDARPTFGVLLNLTSDHLDWHGSEARYRSDKLRLAELVGSGGLVANRSDEFLKASLSGRDDIKWFDPELADRVLGQAGVARMPPSLPGRHNRANLSACLAVLELMDPGAVNSIAGLETFQGLPHRLQSLGTFDGVEFINDSISTAPVATIAALEALQGRPLVLLAGGFERGIEWSPWAEAMRAHPPAALIAMPDNGPKILQAVQKAGIKPQLGVATANDLQNAVERARSMAPEGGVVLLSPGAPSFPYFRDFEDRGQQFAEYVSGDAGCATGEGRKRR